MTPVAGDPPITDASASIVIGSNNYQTTHDGKQYAKYLRGIVIRGDGIREPAYEALVMASDYNICWYRYLGLDYNNREILGASISGDETGNASQMALSFISTASNGDQKEICFNDIQAENAFAPVTDDISLGSTVKKWNNLWAKQVNAERLISPTTAEGGAVDANGKPTYSGQVGELRLSQGSARRRLYICLGGTTWGGVNITV